MELKIACGIILGLFVVAVLSAPTGLKSLFVKDDTDADNKRSGLVIYTDHKTGVQYVANMMGGMTVRVDQNGKPIVSKQ